MQQHRPPAGPLSSGGWPQWVALGGLHSTALGWPGLRLQGKRLRICRPNSLSSTPKHLIHYGKSSRRFILVPLLTYLILPYATRTAVPLQRLFFPLYSVPFSQPQICLHQSSWQRQGQGLSIGMFQAWTRKKLISCCSSSSPLPFPHHARNLVWAAVEVSS